MTSAQASPPEGGVFDVDVQNPSVAAFETGFVVVGNGPDVFHPDRPPSVEQPFVGRAVDARGAVTDIGRPPLGRDFLYPRVVALDSGAIGVFWGEDSSVTTRAAPTSSPRARWASALWFATYAHGRWRSVERVAVLSEVSWSPTAVTTPSLAAGGLHLAVGLTAAHAVVHLVRRRERWTLDTIAVHAPVGYASLAALDSTTFAIAYVAPDVSTRVRDRNSVFDIRSRDGGMSWSAPSLLQRSGARAATDPVALFTPDGRLHVVWGQSHSAQLQANSVHHLTLDGSSGAAVGEDSLDASSSLGHLRAMVHQGDVLVAFQGVAANDRPLVTVSRWRANEGWSASVFGGDRAPARDPALGRDSRGNVVIVYSEYAGMRGPVPVFRSRWGVSEEGPSRAER
jgi:hypothetical protein